MSEPIRFYKGEETRIIKEGYSEINYSLFKGQYYKALNEIGTFLNANSGKDNNIFAFLGDRGTGKTSCMESVAQILTDIDENTKRDENIEEINQNIIAKKNFLVLDIIDPTTFNDETNIMDVVIGTLFEEFKRYVTNNCPKPCGGKEDDYERKKHSVLVKFQEVRRCIKYINNTKCLYEQDDDISQMSDLSSVVKLESLIRELTDAYLEFFNKDILVIKVDDVDLQTKYAYTMVDQIRKYFTHKNIIVLMAVKLEQLSHTIELENAKNYEPLLKLKILKASDLVEMAAKYLLKLIPISKRIYLPSAEVYVNGGLEYYLSKNDKTPQRWYSVKYAITSLIYTKCRYLFYHSQGLVSPIVPRNLRELRHLFAMLVEMNEYNKVAPDHSNKYRFLQYFYNTWVNRNIASTDYQIVHNICNVKDAAAINKVVLIELKGRFGEILKDEFSFIINEKNVSYNISIADVYTILEFVKQRISSIEDKMLIFFIESFYSNKLYEYYDELTDSLYSNEKEGERVHKSILKREVVDGFSNYEILIGGNFINTTNNNFIPKESAGGQSRQTRRINYEELKKLAADVMIDSSNKLMRLQFVEFFALCISRIIDSDNINTSYRSSNRLYYKFNRNSTNKYAIFDLGAFFFNILNIERAYSYVNPGLFEVAKNNKNSLYNKLMDCVRDERGYDLDQHSLLSCVGIRNFEVLSDFVNELANINPNIYQTSSNRENISTFFNQIGDYSINTYDIKESETKGIKALHIYFNYAKVISEELNCQSVTNELKAGIIKQRNRFNPTMTVEKHNVIEQKIKKLDEQLKAVFSDAESIFDSIFVTSAGKVAKEEDFLSIDAVMALFTKDDYARSSVRRKTDDYYRELFVNYPALKKSLHLLIDENSKDKSRLTNSYIREILTQFIKEIQLNLA